MVRRKGEAILLSATLLLACESAQLGSLDGGLDAAPPSRPDASSDAIEAGLDAAPAPDASPDSTPPPDVRDTGAPDAPDARDAFVADGGADAAPDGGVECELGAVEACGAGDFAEPPAVCRRGTRTCVGLRACTNTCSYAFDRECDDGRPDAGTSICAFGTDCGDCGDARGWGPCLDAIEPRTETCNLADDDCDGEVDEGVLRTYYRDADGDGFGDSASTSEGCTAPMGFVVDGTDCDDANVDRAPGRLEVCDGVDNDCDSIPDPTDPCATPPPPTPRFPWNGLATGSSLAPTALLPRFRWDAVAGVSSYQLQVDDSCDPTTFRVCTLPSPELDVRTGTTDLTATSPLPVETTTRPFGRRYYWHARACVGDQCSAWSEVRYLDVGRARSDLDGDGYGDVAAGAPGHSATAMGEGLVLVFGGTSSGAARTATVPLHPPAAAGVSGLGAALAAGDLDGDGFADLAVGAPEASQPEAAEGAVVVYFGSATGPSATGALTIDDPADQPGARFGAAIAIGDVDADGIGDLLVAAPSHDAALPDVGIVYVLRGATSRVLAVTTTLDAPGGGRDALFGTALDVAGDVDGDGFLDVVVGAPGVLGRVAEEGSVYVFRGATDGPLTTALRVLRLPSDPRGWASPPRFGQHVVGSGDFDGDGFSDVLVHALAQSSGMLYDDVAAFDGDATTPLSRTRAVFETSWVGGGGMLGVSLASSDLDGSGRWDVIAAGPAAGATSAGRVAIFYNNRETGPSRIDSPFPAGADYGAALGVVDTNGDGREEILVGAPSSGTGAVVRYPTPTSASTALDDASLADGDRFGAALVHAAP